jgi:segregation and condensation protein B
MSTESQPNSEPPAQAGISLRELTAAFAQAMGFGRAKPAEGEVAEPEAHATADAQPPAETPDAPPAVADAELGVAAADACPIGPQTILEALLFVGNRDGQPLTAGQAAELMRGVELGEVGELVDGLNRRYGQGGCPYHVIDEGAGYRLTLRKSFASLRDRFYGRIRETRLSQAAVDVLAIVAYRQPITAEQVRRLRDKPSGRILSQLVRRGLLRVERGEAPPHKLQYSTAPRFLELFGLESLDDLPQSEEPD